MAKVYLLTGSNLGDKKNNLEKAISLIEKHIGDIVAVSSVYETEPWGFSHDENFLNQVVELRTFLSPVDLLFQIEKIENEFGRERKGYGYAARILDVDILFYDNLIFDLEDLTIPHPRMHLRLFTLIPLAELNPEFIHPVLKKTVAKLIAECDDTCSVVKK